MNALAAFWAELRSLLGTVWLMAKAVVRPPFDVYEFAYQIRSLGVGSLAITNLTGLFAGMVLSLQFGAAMERFGAKQYVGNVVGMSIVRELGPVLTALMVGGRVGAGITAELGSMAVNEQIDAIRALGADPVQRLIVPRVLAATLVLPLLTAVADIVGIAGGMFVAHVTFDVNYTYFYKKMFETILFSDYLSGIGKTPFFGFSIAMIACHVGFHTTGGTEGVGRATTRTVVISSIWTLILNLVLTRIFMGL